MLKPSAESDVIFSALNDIFHHVVRNYGQVSEPGALDPSSSNITGNGMETAVVGETSTIFFQAINFMGQPYQGSIQSSECELVSELTGSRTRGSIERIGDSQYKISLPAHHQREAPASCQGGRLSHRRKSICGVSELTSGEARHSNPNITWSELALGCGHQPEGGGYCC